MGITAGDWRGWGPADKVKLLERLKQRGGQGWPGGWLPRNDGHLYNPSGGQAGFHASRARFRALVGGRGSGKTTTGGQEALGRIKRGLDGLVLSPNIPHFNTSTRPEFWKWLPWEHVTQHHKSEHWLKFDTGATVYYGGIEDEDRWRGPNVNWLWFDEAARKKSERAWLVAVAGVRVGPNPQAWITTTPRGRRHWLYKMFVLQETPDEVKALLEEIGHEGPLYEYFHASIHDNRANLDPLYYASMVSGYTGKFRAQELDGLFVETAEGLVYEDFGPENVSVEAEYDPSRGPVEIAYDDGFASSPRVFLFLQRGEGGQVYLFDELYHVKHLQGVCIGEARDMLRTHATRWAEANLPAGYPEEQIPATPIEIAVGDPSAAELKAALRQADIVARGAKCEIIEGIKRVRSLILNADGVRRLVVHPRCRNFIGEISEGYQYPEGSEGSTDVKPVKENDHGMDAIRYWAWLRTHG